MARKVFLSFSMEDRDFVERFRGWAEGRQSALLFRDYPIKERFERAWKTNVERLIRSCSVTMCLIGRETHQSQAVDWEIRKSAELGKYIMAVAIGTPSPIMPPSLAELNVSPLPWDLDRIVAAGAGVVAQHAGGGVPQTAGAPDGKKLSTRSFRSQRRLF